MQMCGYVLDEFNFFVKILSEMVSILILVLVSQTKTLLSGLAILAAQLSFPKISRRLVVSFGSKLRCWFLQLSLEDN